VTLVIQSDLESCLCALLGSSGLVVISGRLGPLKSLTRPSDIDLTTQFGSLSQNRHIVVVDRKKPAVYGRLDNIASRGRDPNWAVGQKGKHRLMLREDTDLTIKGASDNPAGGTRPDLPVYRN
jgi:hypothetical protein